MAKIKKGLTILAIATAAAAAVGAASVAARTWLSDKAEGAQDVVYGKFNDSKKSINPIRDGLFGGNQKVYDTVQKVATDIATAGTVVFRAAGELAAATGNNANPQQESKAINVVNEEQAIKEETNSVVSESENLTADSEMAITTDIGVEGYKMTAGESEGVVPKTAENEMVNANVGNVLEGDVDDILIQRRGTLKNNSEILGQSHHLNQNAAFKDVIPREEGMAIKLEGNIFTDIGSPHYNAHKSMEEFWSQYRKGGEFIDKNQKW